VKHKSERSELREMNRKVNADAFPLENSISRNLQTNGFDCPGKLETAEVRNLAVKSDTDLKARPPSLL
jgi:hypothetical protein